MRITFSSTRMSGVMCERKHMYTMIITILILLLWWVSTIPTTFSVPGTDSGCIHAVAVDPWPDAEVGDVMKVGTYKPIDLVRTGKPSPPRDVYCDTLGKHGWQWNMHHLWMESSIQCGDFPAMFDETRGYVTLKPIKPPFSHGLPVVFPCVSTGFSFNLPHVDLA